MTDELRHLEIFNARKRPLTIQAAPVTNLNTEAVAAWVNTSGGHAIVHTAGTGNGTLGLTIETLEGPMAARPGWWVIRGVKGEFYPCEGPVFNASYDLLLSSPDEQPGARNQQPTKDTTL